MGTCPTEGCNTIGIYQWVMYDKLPPIFCLSVTATTQKKTSGVSPSTGNTVNLPIGKPRGPREDERAMVRVPRVSCHSSTISILSVHAHSSCLHIHTRTHKYQSERALTPRARADFFFSTRTHAHTHTSSTSMSVLWLSEHIHPSCSHTYANTRTQSQNSSYMSSKIVRQTRIFTTHAHATIQTHNSRTAPVSPHTHMSAAQVGNSLDHHSG